MEPVGVAGECVTDRTGACELPMAHSKDARLFITAEGFESLERSIAGPRVEVGLALAPRTDAVQVLGSTIDVAGSQQGGRLSVITAEELRNRNEAGAADLLRYIPGVVLAQNGGRGSVQTVILRGR